LFNLLPKSQESDGLVELLGSQKKQRRDREVLFGDVELIDSLEPSYDPEVTLFDNRNHVELNGDSRILVSKNLTSTPIITSFRVGNENGIDFLALQSVPSRVLSSVSSFTNFEMGITYYSPDPSSRILIALDGFIRAMPSFLAFDPQEFDRLMKKYNSPRVKNESWTRNCFDTWRHILNLDCSVLVEDLSFRVLL
jgi:hypothetical protein